MRRNNDVLSLKKIINTVSIPVLSIYAALSFLYLIFCLDPLAASLLSDSHILKIEGTRVENMILSVFSVLINTLNTCQHGKKVKLALSFMHLAV